MTGLKGVKSASGTGKLQDVKEAIEKVDKSIDATIEAPKEIKDELEEGKKE